MRIPNTCTGCSHCLKFGRDFIDGEDVRESAYCNLKKHYTFKQCEHYPKEKAELVYVKSDHIFTDYAHAKQRGDTKEAERLGKAIDDNAELASRYVKEIQEAYALAPDLPKFSFMEWLKMQGVAVIEENSSKLERVIAH